VGGVQEGTAAEAAAIPGSNPVVSPENPSILAKPEGLTATATPGPFQTEGTATLVVPQQETPVPPPQMTKEGGIPKAPETTIVPQVEMKTPANPQTPREKIA